MAYAFYSTLGTTTTDRVQTTYAAHSNSGRSYSFWAYRRGNGGSNFGRVFDKRDATAGAEVEICYNQSGTEFRYGRRWSGGTATWSVSGLFATTTWVHVVITYDGSSTANDPIVYLNGASQTVSEVTAPSGTITDNDDTYCIGNRGSDNARGWDGMIAEFAIWNRILTAAEADALGADHYCPAYFPNSLVCYVPLLRDVIDLKNAAPTVTGALVAVHPRVIYLPGGRQHVVPAGGTPVELAGTSSLTFTPAGDLEVEKPLAGTSTLTFTPAGDLEVEKPLAGTSTLTFTPAAALEVEKPLAGVSTLSFAPSGALDVEKPLAGETTLAFGASGDLRVGSAVDLAGVSTLSFAVTADLEVDKLLVGATTASFTVSGALDVEKPLAGMTTVSFAPSGALDVEKPLAGMTTLVFSAVGALSVAALNLPGRGSIGHKRTRSGSIGSQLTRSGSIGSKHENTGDIGDE